MKKFSVFLICAIVVFAISCEEKEKSQEFSVNGTKITNETTLTYDAVATEGSITLNFKSSDKWYTTIDNSASDWLSISPRSGLNSNIKITYRENDKMEERTGKIQIKADEISFYISVKQAAKPFVAFEFAKGVSFEKTVPHSTGEETFAFKANVENWTAKSSVDWLMVSPAEGEKGDQILTFAFTKNEGKVNREGKITVSSGDSSFVIKVIQKLYEPVFIFEEGVSFTRNVNWRIGFEMFSFQCNATKWTATSSADWLTVTPTTGGKGKHELTIEFDKNVSKVNREGEITVRSGDSSFVIKVIQRNNDPFFVFAQGVRFSKKVVYQAGTEIFSFKSNIESWTAKSSVDWLTVTPTQGGKGDQVLTINWLKNEDVTDREGKITVNSGDSSFFFRVTQAKNTDAFFEFEEGTNFSKNVPYTAGTETFTFKANVANWTAKSSQDWLKVTASPGGKGNQTLTISFEHNEARTAREGTITVSSDGVSFTVTVTQARNSVPCFEFEPDVEFTKHIPYNPYNYNPHYYEFHFKSNVEGWTARFDGETGSNSDWLSVYKNSPTYGKKGNVTLRIYFDYNSSRTEREGTVTVSKDDSSFTIKFIQGKNTTPVFEFPEDVNFTLNYGYKSSSQKFNFYHNSSYSCYATSSADWLTAERTGEAYAREQEYTISCRKNEDRINDREGTITIKDSKEDSSFVIKVFQAKSTEPYFTNYPTLRTVDGVAGSTTIMFNSTVDDWNASSSVDWMTVSPTSGRKGNSWKLTVNFTQNDKEETEREGKITVSKDDSSFTVTVRQSKFDIFSVMDDEIFKTYCKQFDINNDGKLFLGEGKLITEIDVSNTNVQSLKGIEYFPNLTTLICEEVSKLTYLDVTNNMALKHLSCTKSQLTSLDVSKNTALEFLDCSSNQLTSLDVSKNTALRNLKCDYNKLKSLDVRTCTALEYLDCSNASSSTLNNSQLTSLNASGCTALKKITCANNSYLKSLDASGCTALEYLNCSYYIYYSIYSAFSSLNVINVSGCTALTYLSCFGGSLTSLDVSSCTSLTYLSCDANQLTSLDVSSCTALDTLNCSYNSLTSLEVSKNTALTDLKCRDNKLTELDVSNHTALMTLVCSENQLISLDVSSCTALDTLNCSYNSLTSLDVSKNTVLTWLSCRNNQLTELDVSNNTALTTLVCSENQLTSLDVSNHTVLKTLSCQNYEYPKSSKLTSLNVSGCIALEKLTCSYNKLTSLEVSGCMALKTLDCNYNQLTSLNVSGCIALEKLNCDYNQLTFLNVSSCTALNWLYCHDNKLTYLYVNSCTFLSTFACSSNLLSDLDVSACALNMKLYCNPMKNESGQNILYTIYARKGQNIEGDIPSSTIIEYK